MRISVTTKIFFIFCSLSLVTLAMGLLVYFALNELAVSNVKIRTFTDFKLQVKDLEAFNIDRSGRNVTSVIPRLEKELNQAELLVEDIKLQNATTMPDNINERLHDLDSYMRYYRQAALELENLVGKNWEIYQQNNRMQKTILQLSQKSPEKIKGDVIKIFTILEQLRDEIDEDNDAKKILLLKESRQNLDKLTDDSELLKIADNFVLNVEMGYLNSLAIADHRAFLARTSERFSEITNNTINIISLDNEKEQERLRHLIAGLIIFSFSLTIFFWLMTSRQLSNFLTNQNKAIEAIKSGEYEYAMPIITADELGELTSFMKQLAINIKEQIVEREKAEQEKKNLQDQLLQAQKLESVGILAGGIAHDFNNLLTAITGYADLALAKTAEDHPIHNNLKMISKAGMRAADLTKQLLAFSRKQFFDLKIIDINLVINDLLKMMIRIIGEDVILEVKADHSIKNVKADQTQIEQILMNMAVNARDAMPGGGRLTIETSSTQLDADYTKHHEGVEPGEYVLITISDTGHGMSREVQKKIFDPFFTTKELGKGTGLGLATVFGIVKQHQGHLWVYSEPDMGTTFKIYLPVSEEEKEEESPALEEKVQLRGTENILVVDDDRTVREFLRETLEFYGYKISMATSGIEAVEIADQSTMPFDLLLTDVIMPEMNGRELAVKIRQIIPGIKIIFMSGYAGRVISPDEVAAAPDISFLSKPITPAVLTKKIRELFDC
ncbi:MAG: response regulator [Proteobacteria bacterium]|nr:response regulator [Pseudomonadota bacterium]MBU1716859.1 response regulator [Pseudomonadota bacterium]